ncbi:LuxR C-terminal-related transcriptional regulator [Polaribacter sp. Z014]|uniref:LuxR C-terminal-related transcriptional regulator n=1 Tax=Polaribacter sp. Z014 TaxID=2927126 RepID=UPI0020221461|nr:LuxR C-terminal-related transcriptional regulator [Polaribacter sp. Z014]MCL7765208.1 LuxR C-terminal-related transcriptional regulator [Polaribacter sp. Z014]
MYYKVIFTFLFFFSLKTNSQNLDSIFISKKEIVKSIKTNKDKVQFLYECGEYFYSKNVTKSEYFFKEALLLAKGSNSTMEGRTLFKLGFIEKNRGNLSTCLRYFNEAKDIFENTNDTERFASIHFDIGYVYRYKNQMDKEFSFYKKGLKLSVGEDELVLGKGYLHLGNYYTRLKKLDSSIYFYNKSLDIFKRLNRDDRVYNVYNNVSNTYYKQGKYKKVIAIRTLVLKFAKKEDNKLLITVNYHNLAAAYSKLNEYVTADKYLDSALIVAKENNFKLRLSKSYSSIAKVNFMLKNYEKSYRYLEKHKVYSDSIIKSQLSNTIKEVELKNKLKLEKKNLQILNQEQVFEKRLYLIIIGVFLLLGIPLVILYHRNSVNKNQIIEGNLEKEKIKKEVLQQKFKRSEVEIKSLVADNSMRLEFLKQLLLKLKNERKSAASVEVKNYIKDLSFKIQQQITTDSKLTLLKNKIDAVNDGFDNMLITTYKELTKTEREVCSLLRLNLSVKEIASIRNSSPDAIKVTRYRIRKKMNVPKDTELEVFIKKLEI